MTKSERPNIRFGIIGLDEYFLNICSFLCFSSGGTADAKVYDVFITVEERDEILEGTYEEVMNEPYEFIDNSDEGWGTHEIMIVELPGDDGVFDAKDLADILSRCADEGIIFGNFYIDGHGSYDDPSFRLGDDKITKDNLSRTSVLKPFFEGHNVFILSCHTGGGEKPGEAIKFVQNASNLWGATVFANRSWTRGGDPFDGTPLSHSDQSGGGNAGRFSGQWLMARPNGIPQIIKNLTLYNSGYANQKFSYTR